MKPIFAGLWSKVPNVLNDIIYIILSPEIIIAPHYSSELIFLVVPMLRLLLFNRVNAVGTLLLFFQPLSSLSAVCYIAKYIFFIH